MVEITEIIVDEYLSTTKRKPIRDITCDFDMTSLKVRKILITAGAFKSDISEQINDLYTYERTIAEIQRITGLSYASVNSYLPYTKVVYNKVDISQNATRIKRYRERKRTIENLKCVKKIGNSEAIK